MSKTPERERAGHGRRAAYPPPGFANQAWWPLGLVVTVGAAAVWFGRRLGRLEVTGVSMIPTLAPGDRVVIWKGGPVRAGDVVAFETGDDPPTMVKRVRAVLPGGAMVVEGDNATVSVDSRRFGPVRTEAVLGRVVYRYSPELRTGSPVTRG